jgi:hypothetical protein
VQFSLVAALSGGCIAGFTGARRVIQALRMRAEDERLSTDLALTSLTRQRRAYTENSRM